MFKLKFIGILLDDKFLMRRNKPEEGSTFGHLCDIVEDVRIGTDHFDELGRRTVALLSGRALCQGIPKHFIRILYVTALQA